MNIKNECNRSGPDFNKRWAWTKTLDPCDCNLQEVHNRSLFLLQMVNVFILLHCDKLNKIFSSLFPPCAEPISQSPCPSSWGWCGTYIGLEKQKVTSLEPFPFKCQCDVLTLKHISYPFGGLCLLFLYLFFSDWLVRWLLVCLGWICSQLSISPKSQ